MATTIRLENWLRKLKMAPITSSGYGDIFSYYDYIELAKTVKNILKAKGYIYIQGDGDLYEPDTKLYHKAMRFKYSMFI